MSEAVQCPVCLNIDGGVCRILTAGGADVTSLDCDICGTFDVTGPALVGPLNPDRTDLTPIQRAALSHRLRTASRDDGAPLVTTDWLDVFLPDATLPSPSAQAAGIIRHVGDEVRRSGLPLGSLPLDLAAIVGAPSRTFALNLAIELRSRGVLTGIDAAGGEDQLLAVGLTLDGWQYYEAEKRGEITGDYGVAALPTDDPVVDAVYQDVLAPAVRDELDLDLMDLRHVAVAPVVDNVLRAQLRDAAFVIADLSRDSTIVTWAAGYAEGLRKPVIYTCETKRLKKAKPPFDRHHATMLVWSRDEPTAFRERLVATLRLSLNRLPPSL